MTTIKRGENQNKERNLQSANDIVSKVWGQGRRVLVVLGAGASVEAGIPKMADIFSLLRKRMEKLVGEWEKKKAEVNRNSEQEKTVLRESKRLEELRDWLATLAVGTAPRSTAAKALGMMQRAHEQISKGDLFKRLHAEWLDFSKDFIRKMTDAKQPTGFHKMVAGWAIAGRADLISVNFDGLTRKALQELLDQGGEKPSGTAIVLSEPSEISKYFLGDVPSQDKADILVPVFKVWGDVFHAVCINKRCPQSGVRAPIFRLEKKSEPPENICPDCHCERQLQIFFAGYEEKERSTTETMTELMKYVAPRVGCILSVGFSGLWDQALIKFLATISTDLDKEQTWGSRLADGAEKNKGSTKPVFWINVDIDQEPPLLQELASCGVTALNLTLKADEFSTKVPKYQELLVTDLDSFTGKGTLPDEKWATLIEREKPCPAAYADLVSASLVSKSGYLEDLGLLRQLGIKTHISLAAIDPKRAKTEEPKHNRQRHSFGAAHLAILWFQKLVEKKDISLSPSEKERLATVVMLAAVHHDIGHLPFTHLAEDIFSELHWTLEDWSDAFHHDEPVLANCYDGFKPQVFRLTEDIARKLKVEPVELRSWVEAAIQGRSGYHWLDAILNSPIDADKLDYVFRDCDYLNQGIHIPLDEKRQEWVLSLFNNTRVLPSGLIALNGIAGEHARDFLEERIWLYKHQYHQPGFRALEKLAASIVMQWLLRKVPTTIIQSPTYRSLTRDFGGALGDTASLKGRTARQILWEKLKKPKDLASPGEPQLLLDIATELVDQKDFVDGLPPSPRLRKWAELCRNIIKSAFYDWHPQEGGAFTLMQHLTDKAGITCSEPVHIPVTHWKRVREIVRQIETLHPFRAVFDIALAPRMLSYPSRRRLSLGGEPVYGECFAVAHKDPDRWSITTDQWIPLSESAFAERDKNRWAKILVVSPESYDPSVAQSLDRFRNLCREENIPLTEVDPAENLGYIQAHKIKNV